MTDVPPVIDTLPKAKARIEELEAALDEAFTVIARRDDALLALERRVINLESRLESLEGN